MRWSPAAGSAGAGVTRMGGNRACGFRRAADVGRAIARDPSALRARGPPNNEHDEPHAVDNL